LSRKTLAAAGLLTLHHLGFGGIQPGVDSNHTKKPIAGNGANFVHDIRCRTAFETSWGGSRRFHCILLKKWHF